MTAPKNEDGTPVSQRQWLMLIAERDALAALLRELVALVRGECPSLLNEDSGGDAKLSCDIDAALKEKT